MRGAGRAGGRILSAWRGASVDRCVITAGASAGLFLLRRPQSINYGVVAGSLGECAHTLREAEWTSRKPSSRSLPPLLASPEAGDQAAGSTRPENAKIDVKIVIRRSVGQSA